MVNLYHFLGKLGREGPTSVEPEEPELEAIQGFLVLFTAALAKATVSILSTTESIDRFLEFIS